MGGVWRVLTRRKVLDESSDILKHNRLSRQLVTGDLVALGVGSTLGLGVYVLAGHVARDMAGPSVILSFLIAAVASVFAGLCYAEFGARVPRAGSAYIYSYVCVGEFIAFIIGWNLILEYVIGSASVSRGISLYLDTLLNDTLKTTFKEIAPIHVSFMSDYFDLLAFGLAFFFGIILAFGVKESATFNNVFTTLNIGVVIFVIIAGSIKADFKNWNISPEDVSPLFNVGEGGFFPFGIAGTLKGAATCFFGFVGFDCIATTGEEVHNPRRAIPISIVTSLVIIFLAYFGISTVLTLMWPYYLQDANAPIPFAFGEVGWVWAKWIVAIGGMFGLLSSLFGSMFPLPRILYAMASDGLVFRCFGTISPRFKSPVLGTMMASLLTGTMAGLFELSHLVNMMSIGTLMAYTIVAACVLLLRLNSECDASDDFTGSDESYSLLDADYDEEEYVLCTGNTESSVSVKDEKFELEVPTLNGAVLQHESSYLMSQSEKFSFCRTIKQLFNCGFEAHPSRLSSFIVGTLITLYCVFSVALSLMIIYQVDELVAGTTWVVVLTSLFGTMMLLCVLLICLQPKSNSELSFKVPLVPFIPCISIFINIYLMLILDVYTWIRFGVWMALGIPIYVCSLYIYERDGDYLMYAQKTSLKSQMSGNLNYAFENMEQCQERANSFQQSDVKIIVQSSTPTTSEESIDKTALEMDNAKQNNSNQNGHENVEPVKVATNISHTKIDEVITSEDIDEVTNARNLLRESFREIEKLDQVLQEEEDSSHFSELEPVMEDVPIQVISLIPEYSPIPSPNGSPTLLRYGDGNTVIVSSEQSVVALVHREDDPIHNRKKRTDSALSISAVTPSEIVDEDNISTSNEDVNLHETDPESKDSTLAENPLVENLFVPPPPPPMDETYFAPKTFPIARKRTTKSIITLPRPDYDDVKRQTQNVENKEEDDTNFEPLKIGTDRHKSFSNKLSAILKNPTGAMFSKKKRLRRSSSQNTLEDGQTGRQESFTEKIELHRSEPSIFASLKKEIEEHGRQEPSPSQGVLTNKSNENDNLLKTPSSTESSRKISTSNPNKSQDNEDENSEPFVKELSRKDLKLKLESLIGNRPPSANPRSNKQVINSEHQDSTKDNNLETEQFKNSDNTLDESIIKPKTKENYSNTMKLRYGDVLKSIQLKGQIDSADSNSEKSNDGLVDNDLPISEDI